MSNLPHRSARPDPDESEDIEDRPDAGAARARERSRIRAILTSPYAERAPSFASYLAFETAKPRRAALAMLERLPNQTGLDAHMSGVTRSIFSNGSRSQPADRLAITASWDAAFAKQGDNSRAAMHDRDGSSASVRAAMLAAAWLNSKKSS